MIRILIADDHPIIREGLKHIISDTNDLLVSGEASNGRELMKLVLDNTGDIVLLDINMPEKNGFEVLEEIVKNNIDIPVIMMSMYPVERYANLSQKRGAACYLDKGCASDELIATIRKVAFDQNNTDTS